MYANFTEETCTGTGATLTLAGATSGNIPFSASFADGDLVAYVVEDSGGSIKVAGVGTWNTGGTITRDDTWNYNGTVVDKNPSANIALSGGAHTVRCDVVGERLLSKNVTVGSLVGASSFYHIPDNMWGGQDSNYTTTANRMYTVAAVFNTPRLITSFVLNINTSDGLATNTRQGIYLADSDGNPSNLLEDSGNIDVSTTGLKTTNLVTPRYLAAGLYYFAVVSDSSIVRWRSLQNSTSDNYAVGQQPTGAAQFNSDRVGFKYQDGVTGALPATFVRTSSTNNVPICAGFK